MWCAIPNRKLSNQSHIHTRKSSKLYTFMTWPFLWQRTLHAWASGRANFYPQEDISWCHRFRLRVAALSHHREAIRWDCPRSVLLSYGPVDHLILDDKWSIRKIRVPRKRRWVLHDRLSVNVNLPVFPVGISLWLFCCFVVSQIAEGCSTDVGRWYIVTILLDYTLFGSQAAPLRCKASMKTT
jgi:hypothetical protein